MAEILPLRAWRYNENLGIPLEQLVSPLFDVASAKQLMKLYQFPFNSIHITLPDKAAKPGKIIKKWKHDAILIQDREPAIYVYYQYFTLPNDNKEYCRKGFIAQIKAYNWEEKVILRHEDTIPSSVSERVQVLKETLMQSSPTHGLYEDKTFHLEKYMDDAMKIPLYDIIDDLGVRDVLARITDPMIVKKFLGLIKSKKIILADGHHRIQAAIEYKNKCTRKNPYHNGKEGYNYHMMYFTNSSSNNLKILPTHRLLKNIQLTEKETLTKAKKYFDLIPLSQHDIAHPNQIKSKWSFILLTKKSSYGMLFKRELFKDFTISAPAMLKELDISILHFFFVDKTVGIPLNQQRYSNSIEYANDLEVCQQKLSKEEVAMVLLTRAIKIEEIIKVCNSGHILPQKSTYFYPKLLSGLLFGSIKEEEFNYPYYNYQ
ncbi:DUF1015 domain-containing protein [Echinicola marina]|nr:DUF1015 domain-containing protein [Echinicola marina]